MYTRLYCIRVKAKTALRDSILIHIASAIAPRGPVIGISLRAGILLYTVYHVPGVDKNDMRHTEVHLHTDLKRV